MSGLFKILSSSLLKSTLKKNIKYYSSGFNPKAFIIVRVTPNDFESVMDLFWNSYYVSEPTVVAAGLAHKRNPVFESHIMGSLVQGMSLMAKCRSSGKIVGAAINTALCPWDVEVKREYANSCSCKNMSELLEFYAFVTSAPKLWCKYGEIKIFEITYLTTDPHNRGRQIGYTLVKNSLALGKDLSYKVLRVDATSQHTQSICEKLHMKKIYELPYKSYTYPDGKPVLLPPPPHTSVKVYVTLPHGTTEITEPH